MALSTASCPLVLGSGSGIRRQLLAAAGVEFQVDRPRVDEEQLKQATGDGDHLPGVLADAKALEVSSRYPEALVIGSDSIATCSDRRFDKPRDRQDAAEHLRFFSGKTLRLTSSASLAQDGAISWRTTDCAALHVRPLSDDFIDEYLAAEWPEVGHCAGAFRLEGRGATLFTNVEGSHFTVLGLPLLPLLAELRARGVMTS